MEPININTMTWVNGRSRLNQTNMNKIENNISTIANKVNELVDFANGSVAGGSWYVLENGRHIENLTPEELDLLGTHTYCGVYASGYYYPLIGYTHELYFLSFSDEPLVNLSVWTKDMYGDHSWSYSSVLADQDISNLLNGFHLPFMNYDDIDHTAPYTKLRITGGQTVSISAAEFEVQKNYLEAVVARDYLWRGYTKLRLCACTYFDNGDGEFFHAAFGQDFVEDGRNYFWITLNHSGNTYTIESEYVED